MAVPARRQDSDTNDGCHSDRPAGPETTVSMHTTRPETSVFVEEDNVDGWIATDLTVPLER